MLNINSVAKSLNTKVVHNFHLEFSILYKNGITKKNQPKLKVTKRNGPLKSRSLNFGHFIFRPVEFLMTACSGLEFLLIQIIDLSCFTGLHFLLTYLC